MLRNAIEALLFFVVLIALMTVLNAIETGVLF